MMRLVLAILVGLAAGGAAEAATSQSDQNQLEVGTANQGGGTASSTRFRQTVSVGEAVAGTRIASSRFRITPGFVGSALSASTPGPVTELDLTVLIAKTDAFGQEIPAQTWQRDRDPIFLWDPPETGPDVAGYSYAIDGVPDDVVDTTETRFDVATSALRTLADGKHTFTVKAVSSAGTSGAAASFELWIDTLPPVIAGQSPLPGALLSASTATVTATITDAGSGVTAETLRLTVNGAPATLQYDAAAGAMSASQLAWREGVNSLELRASDAVGNAQTPVVWSVTVDTQPPTGAVVINGGAALTTSIYVTLSLDASDATSGVSRILLSNTEDRGYVEEPFVSIRDLWKLPAIRATHTVYVKFVDLAGNVSEPVSDAIELALLSPETVITAGPAGVSTTLHAAFEFSCPEGGCVYAFAFDDDGWSEWSAAMTATASGLAYGNHYFRVKAAKDVNGAAGIQADEEDPTPAERTWVVGTDTPLLTVPKGPPIKVWRIE